MLNILTLALLRRKTDNFERIEYFCIPRGQLKINVDIFTINLI